MNTYTLGTALRRTEATNTYPCRAPPLNRGERGHVVVSEMMPYFVPPAGFFWRGFGVRNSWPREWRRRT